VHCNIQSYRLRFVVLSIPSVSPLCCIPPSLPTLCILSYVSRSGHSKYAFEVWNSKHLLSYPLLRVFFYVNTTGNLWILIISEKVMAVCPQPFLISRMPTGQVLRRLDTPDKQHNSVIHRMSADCFFLLFFFFFDSSKRV
jgi:hypothetical protein